VTPEGTIKRQICDYLALRHWEVIHLSTTAVPDGKGGFRTNARGRGNPDLLAFKRGMNGLIVVMAIEVKSAAGRLSDNQKEFKARWEREGGLFIVARSIEDIQREGL
jgi:hypothetical protein